MPVLRRVLRAALLLAGALATGTPSAQERPWIAVIVPAGETQRFTPRELALIFQRKKLYADDGTRMTPVNLPADHALRERFSRAVLGLRPEALEEYWNQQYFQGVLPPHVVGSEQAMLRFVAATAHAVGYTAACYAEPGLRTVLLIDPAGELKPADQQPACAESR
ncbi:hypothetical protein DFR24_2981 [Panacagrimonas perspica]|uniref:Uncharacterized protein n=1 Tax=Panacagrimonas perspica TaxID=381431 RepID=A0A4V3F5D0_9GAMM|nr:hypothetical protein [Panacagrimonas perspica]TDU28606.1 hypothetical protein DFR24_2981 [Panacagrimonas perspica]THD04940.1 hypothetical protein B1810_03045 [Panacagrimonas perspica]